MGGVGVVVRIKEIKISIHRKYTKDFQSYGYRVGLQLDVDKDDPRSGYYEGKVFLNDRIAEEDLIIKNLMDKRDAEKGLGYKELVAIPERKVGKNDLVGAYKELKETYKELEKRKLEGGEAKDGDVMIPYDVKQIKRTSAKAVLVELFGVKGDVWIPKSCVGDGDAMDLMEKGVKTMLFVKNWFLEKEGLI